MPRGLQIVTAANLLLLLLHGGNLYVFYAEQDTGTLTFVISWIAVAGLLACLLGIAVRSPLWHRLARGALYAIALGFGAQVLGWLPELGRPGVAGSVAAMVLIIVYTIGARGYLNSPPARSWFHLPGNADRPDAP